MFVWFRVVKCDNFVAICACLSCFVVQKVTLLSLCACVCGVYKGRKSHFWRDASSGLRVFEVLSVGFGGMPRAVCLFRKEPSRLWKVYLVEL